MHRCRTIAPLAGLLAGCVLITSPINTAPEATLAPPDKAFVRGTYAVFNANAVDKDQDASTLTYSWYVGPTCAEAKTLATPSASGVGLNPFRFLPDSVRSGCVVLTVMDSSGAAYTTSQTFEVVNQKPSAVIEVVQSADQPAPVPGQPYPMPLFGEVVLSGAKSMDPDEADRTYLVYIWKVLDADQKQLDVDTCPEPGNQQICTFSMDHPGLYTVQLWVTDPFGDKSEPSSQGLRVNDDLPPNIVSFLPQSRNFPRDASQDTHLALLMVEDDGDPFPPFPTAPAGFVWYWRNYVIGGSAQFARLPWVTQATLTIPGGTFQSGDTIQFRVEYYDRVTAWSSLPCDSGLPTCYLNSNRAQWVTWTVSYQ